MSLFPQRLVVLLFLFSPIGSTPAADKMVSDAPNWYVGGTNSNAPNFLWKFAVESEYTGAMSVGNGRILVGSLTGPFVARAGVMIALDTSGRLLWKAKHAVLRDRVHDIGQPIQSQACIDGDRAYYVSNRGELMCVALEGFHDGKKSGPDKDEPTTGAEGVKVIWKIDMVTQLGVFKRDSGGPLCSPIVIGDLVFCITGHGVPDYAVRADPKPPSFLAVHKLTGEIAWSSNAPGANIAFTQCSSPVAARVNGANQVIFPGGDGVLYGFEPATGRQLWKLDCNPPEALDRFRVKWESSRRTEMKCGFLARPVVHGSMLYVAQNEDFEFSLRKPLLAINLAEPDGQPKIVWKFADPAFSGTFTSAAVGNGLVFVTDHTCVLFALDEQTGRECWRAELDNGNAYDLYASPVVHEGRIYAGSEEDLTVFEAAREKKCLGRYGFEDGICGTPQFAGDQFFVAIGSYVYALRTP